MSQSSRKPQHPCIDNPHPTSSTSHVRFVCEQKQFSHKDPLPADFPYKVARDTSNGASTIPYLEFRGEGDPPADVGTPGDVWLDIRPGHYQLWACGRTAWEIWRGPNKSKKDMHPHPLVTGRFLWITRKSVLWYTADGIRKNASMQERGEEDDYGRERLLKEGPQPHGGAGRDLDSANRRPLRSAPEAIEKILQFEEEESNANPSRRRKREERESTPPNERPSSRRRSEEPIIKEPEPSPLSLSNVPLPSAHAPQITPFMPSPAQTQQSLYLQSNIFPQQPTSYGSSSSLSMALDDPISPGIHSQRLTASSSQPRLAPRPPQLQQTPQQHSGTLWQPISQMPASLQPSQAASPSGSGQGHMTSLASTSYPSPQSQSQSHSSPLDGNTHQMMQITRLSSENTRLSEENARLTAEIRRLKEEREQERASGASLLPHSVLAPIGQVVQDCIYRGLNQQLQDEMKKRKEAEEILSQLQRQVNQMNHVFKLAAPAQSLSTPGPSPRSRLPDV
ncbi:unnamed protein product [Peniophora sp. CBMAI 1063]|nr:unnamed protein product [Peniophora sp. CBMAI 1063]